MTKFLDLAGTNYLVEKLKALISIKATMSTTLSGYGIVDAYTKTQVDDIVSNIPGGGGTGAVDSVNGKTGVVVLDSDDVGSYSKAEVDGLISGIPIHVDAVSSVNDKIGSVVLSATDVGAYSKVEVDTIVDNLPKHQDAVESVNGKTGLVVLTSDDVGSYSKAEVDDLITNVDGSVASVNGKTGEVTLTAADLDAVSGSDLASALSDISEQFSTKPDVVIVTTGNEDRPSNSIMTFWVDLRDDTAVKPAAMAETDFQLVPNIVPDVAPHISTTALSNFIVGQATSGQIDYSGTEPVTISVTSGTMPTGVTLNSDGSYSGTPTTEETYAVTITATNSVGSDSVEFSGNVAAEIPAGEEFGVFPTPYPYPSVLGTDGGGVLKLAQLYYSAVNPFICTGGRIWLDTVPSDGDLTIFRALTYSQDGKLGVLNFPDIPDGLPEDYKVTIPQSELVVGWNKINFPTELTVAPHSESASWEKTALWIGAYFAGGNDYPFTSNVELGSIESAIQAVGGQDLYLAEQDPRQDGEGSMHITRAVNSLDTATSGIYCIDIIAKQVS